MRQTKFFYLVMVFCMSTISCSGQKTGNMNKSKTTDPSSGDGKYIISAPIVTKSFVKKNGQPTDRKEYYIQRSIQDYFIKFCESEINIEDMEVELARSNSFIKTLKLEIEYRSGEWDVCDEHIDQQSRVGEYVVVHRIITGDEKE